MSPLYFFVTKIVRFKEESVTDTSAEYAIKDELPAKRKADMNTPNAQSKLAALKTFIRQRENLLVITGAGISTASGIGDYRDQAGNWKRAQPVSHQDFLASYAWRQRYWARSQLGYPSFMAAQPNSAHQALVRMEQAGQLLRPSDAKRRPVASTGRASKRCGFAWQTGSSDLYRLPRPGGSG